MSKLEKATREISERFLKQNNINIECCSTKEETLNAITKNLADFNSLPEDQRKEFFKHNLTIEHNINFKMETIFDRFTTENSIMEKYDELSNKSKLKILVIILDKLEYKKVENDNDLYKNLKILSGIIPNLQINKIANIYSDDINKQMEFLSYIDDIIDYIIEEKKQKRLYKK